MEAYLEQAHKINRFKSSRTVRQVILHLFMVLLLTQSICIAALYVMNSRD